MFEEAVCRSDFEVFFQFFYPVHYNKYFPVFLSVLFYKTYICISCINNLIPQKFNTVMKILVCLTKTPDTTAKIAFTDNNTKFAQAGVQWIINPYDEWYALVRAIELKEKDASISIHLVTVGAADAEPIIRKALALGGDEAIRINADTHDSFYIASQIAEVAKQGAYDIIFTGKETIDYNGSSVGGMLAELLNLPYVSLATRFDLSGTTATVSRE